MTDFEFLITHRPVSLQTRSRRNLQSWKRVVATEARKHWGAHPPVDAADMHLTLVYLYDGAPIDADNIIKPIQDALVGPVLADDRLVIDVESHRRPIAGPFDLLRLPALLRQGLLARKECVYVRLRDAHPLEELL